jgi:hypothetical protein
MPSEARPEFALSSVEQEVMTAVVTKFAADLVLYRLAKPVPGGGAAALEEVATEAAVMLTERRAPTLVESLAVQAMIESVSTGPDDFVQALAASDTMLLTASRLKHITRVIHGKMVGSALSAAA